MNPEQEMLIYPEGRFRTPEHFEPAAVQDAIADIRVLPRLLDYCVENLDAAQLHQPYREEGWSTHQIIHHLADSHMNAFIRCKLALTETQPVIKPYLQEAWALSADVAEVPVNYSITLLHALHHRWVTLLSALEEQDWQRCYLHPEYERTVPLWEYVQLYAWHGRHHSTQIRQLRTRMGWPL